MTAENDSPMPPHNLLVHTIGHVEHGCAACDWLRARKLIPTSERNADD